MSNFPSSPGVSLNEIDNTLITQTPSKAGAAIVGPTVKGPVELPITVTSYSEYKTMFGGALLSGSQSYSYFTSIAAQNYFENGGRSLLVTRVVSGSYTPSISEIVTSGSYIVDGYVEDSYSPSDVAFTLETISEGVIMNSSGSVNTGSGILSEGTSDNIRVEVTTVNTGSGTFDLVIRRGDDLENQKIILESFSKLSLDPNSPRFIAAVIGDENLSYNSTTNQIESTGNYPNKSRYVRVKSINANNLTPNYLDSNGQISDNTYPGKLPSPQNNTFKNATGDIIAGANFYDAINGTNTQGLVSGNYTDMISLLSNKDDYQYNIMLTPGLTDEYHTPSITGFIQNAQNRGDHLYVYDTVGYGSGIGSAITQAQTRNTSYAATYFPWLRTIDNETGKQVWVPASTMMGGVFAFNDKVGNPWFAPAGINRGGLSSVIKPELKLSQPNRTQLYDSNINPIMYSLKTKTSVFGQKTLQKAATALDRVNVRRLLIELKSFIGQVSDSLVFEQNTTETRNRFLATVNPYLDNVKQKQGLYAFKVIMDDTNNTADVIDRNQLVGQIFIQPSRTAEFINIDFVLQPTGVDFE